MSYFSPKSRQKPKRLPRRYPLKTIPSGIRDKGIVANYLMYYLKGGDHLHDFSPYDNHGTINGAKWKDGRYGWGLEFDGVDDHVNLGTDGSLNPANELTVTAWVILDSYSSDFEYIVSREESEWCWILRFSDTGYDLEGYMKDSGGNAHSVSYSDANINIGQWYYVVMTYDGSTQKLYVNGTQVDSVSWSDTILQSTETTSIGASYYAGGWCRFLPGTVAIVRIYKVVKNGAWVSRRFERTKGIFGI